MIRGLKRPEVDILQAMTAKTGIVYKDTSLVNKTQLDGEQVLLLSDSQQNAKEHQVKIDTSVVATGTIAIQVKCIGSTSFDILNDEYGQPVIIDLAASRVFTILIAVEAIKFVPTSVVGNYSVRVVGRG
ncbi:hypothetical protein [Agitococcus lubricus]|uniref:Uncharacterized protein n=1 Tax=Agitococcus lubricus TaxID=1077255 RepID=A0A2T5IPS1_9GAMM|nr:hypothetical protein [Agitococcus lubricus]PTQ85815.1 hypothetical protein C8N29_1493 [Agitococcus lubricus]